MRQGMSVPVNNTKSTEVDVRGGRLPVWTQPGEPQTLVFLHIWGGSHRAFAPVIARLASGCAMVSYDHRGWGAARDLPGPYGISELSGIPIILLVTRRQPGAGPGRGGGQHLIR